MEQTSEHACPPLTLATLGTDALQHVLQYLNPFDLLSLSSVCKLLAQAGSDNALWRPFCHPDWSVSEFREGEEWKQAYIIWLRTALKNYITTQEKQQGRSLRETVKSTDAFAHRGISCELKFTVAGPAGSGKSNFLSRFCWDKFSPEHKPTKAISFSPVELMFEGKAIKIDFWEIGSGHIKHTIRETIRNAHALILIYSMDKADTFIEDMEPFMAFGECHDCAMLAIVGMKSDLDDVDSDQVIPRLSAHMLKASYFQCSAKTGEGIEDVIAAALEHWIVSWCDVPGMRRPNYLPDVSVMKVAAIQRQQQERHHDVDPTDRSTPAEGEPKESPVAE